MNVYDRLRLALEYLTEGERASLPSRLRRRRQERESFRRALRGLEREARAWTLGAGVQGLGIGERIAGGELEDQLVLRVYVKEKRRKDQLRNVVPCTIDVPEAGVVETDVVEIGRVASTSFRGRVRPAVPGSGIAHFAATDVGTFGCLVRRRGRSTQNYLLSNSHVIAQAGLATRRDQVIQPGFPDGGAAPHDVIGRLATWKPFSFDRGYPNQVDAAIAKVAPTRARAEIRLLGAAPSATSSVLRRGMSVHKVGRSTDLTTGEVLDVDFRLRLRFPKPGGGSGLAGFRDQVLCTRLGDKGDSGAAVLNAGGKLVGLYFADSASASIFNRIEHVFRELDLRLP